MKFVSLARAAALLAALPALVVAQSNEQTAPPAPQPTLGATLGIKIAVIDIDRIGAESNAGKALFERLKTENDRLSAETASRQQELRDMEAKLSSEILSEDAKQRLTREIERKRTDAQRWLEDAQHEFQEKQQQGEAEFQNLLAPVVEEVARKSGIGLILRATPGLTFVLDPTLDITPVVIQALNQSATPPPPSGAESKPPSPERED